MHTGRHTTPSYYIVIIFQAYYILFLGGGITFNFFIVIDISVHPLCLGLASSVVSYIISCSLGVYVIIHTLHHYFPTSFALTLTVVVFHVQKSQAIYISIRSTNLAREESYRIGGKKLQ